MFLLKLAVATCLFYMTMSIALSAGLFLLAYAKGSFGYLLKFWPIAFLFGLIWFGSFAAAWHLIYNETAARFPSTH